MKRTNFSRLVAALVLLAACSGDNQNPDNDSATTNPSGSGASASATDSESSASGATAGSAATASASNSGSDTDSGDPTSATNPTTTNGSTSDPTGDTDTTGCSFLACGDLDDSGGTIECDVWGQDCDPGEKCMPWANDGGGAWNSTKCTPVDAEPDAVGAPCTVEGSGVSGIDSCEVSAMCWGVDAETNTGVCVGFCEGNEEACNAEPASCCGPGLACTIANEGVLILCLQQCDPIIQNCESVGDVCYPVGNSFQCAPDVSGEMGAIGDPCEFINVCDPGTFCGNPGAYPGCDPMAGGCCIPFCELDAAECAAMTSCEPWYDPMDVPPGYENLGACVIPQ